MANQDRIDIEIFKVVTRAIAESDDLETMAGQLARLLVGALEIKGCTLFLLNPDTEELESLASFGLSINYLNKGPVLVNRSIDHKLRGEPVVIRNVQGSKRLQYPENARKEGIRAIVSLPVMLYGRIIGALRLYHFEPWDISEGDLDSLGILAEIIGLSLMYTRLLRSMQTVREAVDEMHPIWLDRG